MSLAAQLRRQTASPLTPELAGAAAAADRCGVTRLADITHLDALGVPVLQAIRPWSRALSVHQGKGLDWSGAALGALMEAVESHCAESFGGPLLRRPFSALPAAERMASLDVFTTDGQASVDSEEALEWISGETIEGGRPFWVPFDVVSLDFARAWDARFDRSSDGLACHFDRNDATMTAILEVVERDAAAAFFDLSLVQRAGLKVDISSVPLTWFARLRETLQRMDISVQAYVVPAVIDLPVFVCELWERGAFGAARGRTFGSACDPDPDAAFRRAFLEAVQSRLTAISGARDDILPTSRTEAQPGLGLSLPLPSKAAIRPWRDLAGRWGGADLSSQDIAQMLRRVGYPDAIAIELAPPDLGVSVMKVLVPGLGSDVRRRKAPVRVLSAS